MGHPSHRSRLSEARAWAAEPEARMNTTAVLLGLLCAAGQSARLGRLTLCDSWWVFD